jgi:hypothetical protein
MPKTRSYAFNTSVATAAALTAAGITYAMTTPAPEVPMAPAAARQAPAQAPLGGDTGKDDTGRDTEGGDHGGGREGHHDRHDHDEGWIQINERSYYAHPGGCIAVISGLGSKSLNVTNDSHRTVEVFRGVTCDNGAPIATVGPRSSATGITPGPADGIYVRDGIVGSFRIVGGEGDRDFFDRDLFDRGSF